MSYKSAKGVFDILPTDPDKEGKWRESHLWQYVETIARETAKEYGFKEIRTPLLEATELFERSVGATSDIVSKEMYTFKDRAERSLTLRPEGTAPVMRAFIEKNLAQMGPYHKFFYINPMFRYERQQAGRYRQHHQFGVEAIGSSSYFQDAEVIALFYFFLKRLGIKGLNLQLHSIGMKEEREKYKQALKKYLLPHFNELSSDSKIRFEGNPLRILDSKNAEDKKIVADAPPLLDFLEEESRNHFNGLCQLLEKLHIPYTINPKLVRGLDYYNRTVFEVTAEELGAQNSLGGGGRYDDLLKELHGPDLPAIGFGLGIERIIQTLLGQNINLPESPKTTLFLIALGMEAKVPTFQLLQSLREAKISCEMDFSDKKLKQTMQQANASGAKYVVIVGENELRANRVEVKEMMTGNQLSLSFDELIAHFKEKKN